jgi:predicted phage terminase large subunit-like protein
VEAVRAVASARAFELDPERWLRALFPTYVVHPFAAHHREMWDWVWALRLGVAAIPFVGSWARGGAKSTNAELAAIASGAREARRYVWYCSQTQRQADSHIANIAAMLSTPLLGALYPELGERKLSKYGTSLGWRRNRVMTASGLTVEGIGLDVAIRGLRIDEARPDLIVLDDLDDALDTPATTERKLAVLTRSVLPAQSTHAAVLAIQNVAIPDGIFARLAGVSPTPADFLYERIVSGPVPAIDGLVVDRDDRGHLRIAAGEPTWVGQDLAYCEALLNEIGETAFRIELQHQVELRESGMFDRSWWRVIGPEQVPRRGVRWVRYWDLAATEPTGSNRDPDWTAGALLGFSEHDGLFYLRDIRRLRDTPRGVEVETTRIAELDATRYTREIWIEQEPGASGALTIDHYRRRVLAGYDVRGHKPSGPKHERARPLSAAVEAGNVFVVKGGWNAAFFDEAALFPLPTGQGHDDQIDAVTGALYALTRPRPRLVV